jgi:hypothetical protein
LKSVVIVLLSEDDGNTNGDDNIDLAFPQEKMWGGG